MADYSFFIMFMWLVKVILIAVAAAALILLGWWIRSAFRSRAARLTLLVFLAFTLLVVIVACVSVSRYQTPAKIVERTGALPSLDSIQLTHGKQREDLEDMYVWLRFRLSPTDLAAILQPETYVRLPYNVVNFQAYRPPAWWNLQALGSNTVFYVCERGDLLVGSPYNICVKHIAVNAAHNEALFFVQCGYDDGYRE